MISKYVSLVCALFPSAECSSLGNVARQVSKSFLNQNALRLGQAALIKTTPAAPAIPKGVLARKFTRPVETSSAIAQPTGPNTAAVDSLQPQIEYNWFTPPGHPDNTRTIPVLPRDPEQRRKYEDERKIQMRSRFESKDIDFEKEWWRREWSYMTAAEQQKHDYQEYIRLRRAFEAEQDSHLHGSRIPW